MRAFGFFLTEFGFFSASNHVTEIWLEWMAVAVASFFYILRLWVFFFNLFVPVLGILGCAGFSLAVVSGVYSPAAVWGLRIAGASLLRSTGSIAAAHGLSCSLACGIFLDQGLNWCPPAWQGGFLTIGPSGKPSACTLKTSVKLCHLVLLFPSSLSTVLKPVMFSVYLVWGFYLRKCASSHLWSVLGDTLRWWVTAVAPGSLYCLPRVSDFHGHHLSALPSPRPPECPWLVDIFQIWFYLTLHWF